MNVSNFITPNDVVWIVAPHADDEVLGAGGLLSIAQDVGAERYALFATVSGFETVNGGNKSGLEERLSEVESVMSELDITGYDILFKGEEKHLRLDMVPKADIISWMETKSKYSISEVMPTVILLPSRNHNHQDHQAIFDAGVSVVRTNSSFDSGKVCVLAYELPGTGQTGLPSFDPNVYLELDAETLERKCKLFELYASQVAEAPRLRSTHAIRTLAQFRGLEAGYHFAEAYELLRLKFASSSKAMSGEEITHILYQNRERGLSDLASRQELNVRLGTLDFTQLLMDAIELTDGQTILDVGCGTGRHLDEFLQRYRIGAYGIDPSSKQLVNPDITFHLASGESIPYSDRQFNRILCNYAMYYMDDWQTGLEEMVRVAKDGGLVVITGPGFGNNRDFYDLHRKLFGDISDIDKKALNFLQGELEPHLQRQGYTFTGGSFENRIVYPTADDFLAYYQSTSLFRMTSRERDPEQMSNPIRQAIQPIYDADDKFENTKVVRVVRIKKC